MKILAIIPARKGSKRLKQKNTLNFGNKPLIQITIEFAKKLNNIFDIIVSTNDTKVLNICKKLKVKAPFKRPSNLSNDKATSVSVCEHAINFYEKKYSKIDAILLLQPTSPFRFKKSINLSIKIFKKLKIKSLVSVNKIQINPMTIIERNKNKNKYLFSKVKNTYEINGNFYLIDKKLFLRKKKFFMDYTYLFETKNFKETIDIDDMNDFKIAKSLI